MVGEYIGSQEHQHLVKYSRVTIIFYAIIDNYSAESCWPCSQAWQFFQRYGLDVVHIKSLGTFDNYGVLCDQLEQTFKDVAKSSIAQDEEGNVLYFIKKDKDTGKETTLSLAKLKTLEYRLFRKMREKLRGFYSADKGGTFDLADKPKSKFDGVAKFYNESNELLEGGQNELPKPLAHYVSIFKAAYDFIAANPDQVDVLQKEYVTFSENLLDYISKQGGEEPTDTANFFFSGVLDEQEQITFGKEEKGQKQEEEKE